ncbi:MAG: UDP-N-acetylmuramoyl-L-alanine--D-glutamate ligase [Treponema sp.]|nr:UDP-N-acetylmuramoyl-L-alanine--D-glutamate ligase [Treponema sp.]
MDYSGVKVLVMGLGMHGGGLETACYLLRHGAELAVTDLQDEKALSASVEQLESARKNIPSAPAIRYVLGRHEADDFKKADMVIKNPGVRPDSPFLLAARRIETDISLFLAAAGGTGGTCGTAPFRLTAVTGSKGKSSAASAIHWVLTHSPGKGAAYLGGNITVSPLAFLDRLQNGDDVTLELSSWQLGDLRDCRRANGKAGANNDGGPLIKPKAAVMTAIMPDHMDRYGSMEAYIADKRILYQGQSPDDITVAADDEWGRSFHAESKAFPLAYSAAPLPEGVSGGWFDDPGGPGFARIYGGNAPGTAGGKKVELVPAKPLVPGRHQKQNLLAAGLALLGLGLPPETIREGLASFPGVEHRLELFHTAGGIDFYNDSAATVPEAAAAALDALGGGGRLVLVAGGSDKNLNLEPLAQAAGKAKAIILLAGSGSEKLKSLLGGKGIGCLGPFDELEKAVTAALDMAAPGDSVVLSPGCASFGMFQNEFDRGRKWKEAVKRLA